MKDNSGDGVTSVSVAPQHLNASDFRLINTTTEMTQMLQMHLDRTQSLDPMGTQLMKEGWTNGISIVMNPYNGAVTANLSDDIKAALAAHPGKDYYSPELNAVFWNPYSANQVFDNAGNLLGVQSSGLALDHEMGHGLDGQLVANLAIDHIPKIGNAAEWIALGYEAISAYYLKEPVRENHQGKDVLVDNPTQHTGIDPTTGQTVWIKDAENGKTEYGGAYDRQLIPRNWDAPGQAPNFGSTDPGHATDYNQPTPHDGGGNQSDPGSTGGGDNDDPDHQSNGGSNSGTGDGTGDTDGGDNGGDMGNQVDDGTDGGGDGGADNGGDTDSLPNLDPNNGMPETGTAATLHHIGQLMGSQSVLDITHLLTPHTSSTNMTDSNSPDPAFHHLPPMHPHGEVVVVGVPSIVDHVVV